MKPWYASKTFYAALLTAGVAVGRALAPQQAHWWELAQGLLVSAGLWFARLGAGTPIGPAPHWLDDKG